MNVLVVDADDEVWVGEQRRVFTQRLVGDKVSAENIVADPCVLVVQTATRRQRNVRRCASSTVTTDTITPDSPTALNTLGQKKPNPLRLRITSINIKIKGQHINNFGAENHQTVSNVCVCRS